MKKFEFKSEARDKVFTGSEFYYVYKDSIFLRSKENVKTILSKGHQLRSELKTVSPGDSVVVTGMETTQGVPLMVKNTQGSNVPVENYEFTSKRLPGLVAAYAFDHYVDYDTLECSEAIALGLIWDNSNKEKCRVYLSAVSGSEYFYEQFGFLPLVCALRKLHLGKLEAALVIKIANIKCPTGERLSQLFIKNVHTVETVWKRFRGAEEKRFKDIMDKTPPTVKKVFNDALIHVVN